MLTYNEKNKSLGWIISGCSALATDRWGQIAMS